MTVAAGAQDLITKVDGEEILSKVMEVSDREIKYKRWDNLEGPIYTMSKSKIRTVVYENGYEEVMRQAPVSDVFESGAVRPGMKYREYRKLYNPQDYAAMPGDRYNPLLGGVCSWLIPGLGQMVNGEVGRGFGYLGASFGCYIAAYSGTLLVLTSIDDDAAYSPPAQHYNRSQQVAGTVLMMAGAFAWIAVNICSIVDGVRVAKIKNMYERDVRDMASVSLRLEPYLATTYGMAPNSNIPVAAGASLKIRF